MQAVRRGALYRMQEKAVESRAPPDEEAVPGGLLKAFSLTPALSRWEREGAGSVWQDGGTLVFRGASFPERVFCVLPTPAT